MKKLIFAVAALLALSITACVFTAPEAVDNEQFVMQTEDGRTLVKLGFGLDGNSRALTDNMATVAAERYEVAFYYATGPAIYRTTWVEGQRGNLWVETTPAGINYGAGGNLAILFAGYSNGTLLAVGALSEVNGAPGTTINDASRTVTFTLTPLGNDIFGLDGSPSTLDPTKSTFKITQSGHETALLATFPTVIIDTEAYPVYELDTGMSAVSATYAVSGLPANGIVIAATPKVIPKMIEVPGYWSAKDVTGSFANTLVADAALPTPAGGYTTFGLTLVTRANEGLIKIGFQIPVYAISKNLGYDKLTTLTDVQPGIWYIRGGIANADLDRGTGQDSDGGSVLIGTGTYARPSQIGWINVDN